MRYNNNIISRAYFGIALDTEVFYFKKRMTILRSAALDWYRKSFYFGIMPVYKNHVKRTNFRKIKANLWWKFMLRVKSFFWDYYYFQNSQRNMYEFNLARKYIFFYFSATETNFLTLLIMCRVPFFPSLV